MDPGEPQSLIARLERRKIGQWTVAYLSAAWLTLQVVNVIGQQFAWPVPWSAASRWRSAQASSSR